MVVDEKYLLDQQKEEIEFLVEDRDRYKELFHQAVRNRDEFVALADAKQKQWETASKNYSILYNEKVELQKQVDKLKEELDEEYELRKKHMFSCEQKDLEIKYLEIDKRQAVKDTAKENIKKLRDIQNRYIRSQWREGWNRAFDIACEEIAKHYGVEVE